MQIGKGIVGWVAKTGEPLIVPDVRTDARYVQARPETRSELAAPLMLEGRTIGVFNLESDLDDAYHEGHLDIVQGVRGAGGGGGRAGAADARAARAPAAREGAGDRARDPALVPAQERARDPGLRARRHDAALTTRSAATTSTSSRCPKRGLGLAIADVSGKGIPAALLMAGFRMSLLAEIRNEFAIRAVMRKVNSLVHESTDRDSS